MGLISDIKLWSGYKAERLDISEEAIAFLLQMGWIKKFMGRYIFTPKGVEEFRATIDEAIKAGRI
jgi:hypothetical protein